MVHLVLYTDYLYWEKEGHRERETEVGEREREREVGESAQGPLPELMGNAGRGSGVAEVPFVPVEMTLN